MHTMLIVVLMPFELSRQLSKQQAYYTCPQRPAIFFYVTLILRTFIWPDHHVLSSYSTLSLICRGKKPEEKETRITRTRRGNLGERKKRRGKRRKSEDGTETNLETTRPSGLTTVAGLTMIVTAIVLEHRYCDDLQLRGYLRSLQSVQSSPFSLVNFQLFLVMFVSLYFVFSSFCLLLLLFLLTWWEGL